MSEPTSVRLDSAQTVSLTTASAQSSAIGSANLGQPDLSTLVRLACDADCWLAFGTNPTASVGGANCVLLPAGSPEYVDLPAGYKVAGILAAGTGKLNIAACSKG